mgnify:CR=1 FL=1
MLAASIVLSGCNIFPSEKAEADGSSTTAVKSGKDVAIPASGGAPEVNIPGSAIGGSGKLSVKLAATGPDGEIGWRIELEGAELTGDATLLFKDAVISGEPAPLIGFTLKDGDPINFDVESVVVGNDIQVTTNHFSAWYEVSWDWLKNWARDRIDSMLSSTEGEAPTCSRTEEVKAKGITVSSSANTRAKWCIGLDGGGKTIVKVSNNRGYGVSIESTPGVKLTRRDTSLGSKFQQAVGKVGAYPDAKGNNLDIAGPGELVEYTLSSTAQGQEGVLIKPSPSAFAATALWFAGETATMVWGKLKNGKDNQIAKNVEKAMNAVDCTSGFRNMASSKVMDAAAAGNYFQSAMETVTPCVSQILEKLAGDNFFDKLAVGALSVFTWLASGIKAIFQAGRGAWDTVFGGGMYQIIIDRPTPVATNYCTENLLRKARDQSGQEWMLQSSSDSSGYYYDAFEIHACKKGFALVEASRSSGSAFDFWALTLNGDTWKLVTSSSLGLNTTSTEPVFMVDDISSGFRRLGQEPEEAWDTTLAYLDAIGWLTKNGRDTVGAFDY